MMKNVIWQSMECLRGKAGHAAARVQTSLTLGEQLAVDLETAASESGDENEPDAAPAKSQSRAVHHNAYNDYLHRGDSSPLREMGFYHYQAWVIRTPKSVGRRSFNGSCS